jgi:hypothetical protein
MNRGNSPPDGHVFAVRDIILDERHLDPDYERITGDGLLSPTGRVILFRLQPKIVEMPSFVARWDGGARTFLHKIRYDVDIDMENASKLARWRFRKGMGAYCGHHSVKLSPDENKYRVFIKGPKGVLYDADISFSRHHGVVPSIQTNILTTLLRDSPFEGARSRLARRLARLRRRARQ